MAGAPNYFHSDVMQKWVRTISVLLIYHMKKKGLSPLLFLSSSPRIFTFPSVSRIPHLTMAFPFSSLNLSISGDNIDPLLSGYTLSEATKC